jgi:hypothetical protein
MSAYATAKMFSLSLKHTDYLYSSSACAYFSWVCSTFTGQIEMVKLCTQRALLLASKHSENQLIKCKLILSYKVHHWLYPLSELKTNLQQEIDKIDPANKRYLSIDILLQHLRLCSGSPINTIHQHCNELLNTVTLAPSNLATMAIANLRDTTSRLANKKSDVSNEYVNYQNSMSAFGRLFASFYNFEQRLWPYMQHWDSIIESEISGDFIVTEAVFICTLMRIHCLESNIGKARLRLEKNRLEAYINRLKSWAELCPENFSSQYALANTVFHAKFGSEQSAIDKFEAIIGTLNRCSFLHHKILYYHYYAQVLSLNHPTLAALCLDKKHRLHAQWLNKSKN